MKRGGFGTKKTEDFAKEVNLVGEKPVRKIRKIYYKRKIDFNPRNRQDVRNFFIKIKETKSTENKNKEAIPPHNMKKAGHLSTDDVINVNKGTTTIDCGGEGGKRRREEEEGGKIEDGMKRKKRKEEPPERSGVIGGMESSDLGSLRARNLVKKFAGSWGESQARKNGGCHLVEVVKIGTFPCGANGSNVRQGELPDV